MKSGEYFLDTELLNVLNTQNIIIIDIKWQKDQSRINYFGFFQCVFTWRVKKIDGGWR